MSFGQSLLKSMGSAFGGGASMEKCAAAPVLEVERRSMAVPRPSCAAGKGMAKGRGRRETQRKGWGGWMHHCS